MKIDTHYVSFVQDHVSSSQTSPKVVKIKQNQITHNRVRYCDKTASNSMNSREESRESAAQNEDCTSKPSTTSGYPSYVSDELALFYKLQSDFRHHAADVNEKVTLPTEERIDLGIGFLVGNNLSKMNAEAPENNSDATDCEIIWVKGSDDGSNPDAKSPKKELHVHKSPADTHSQGNVSKNVYSSNNSPVVSRYGSIFLSAGMMPDISNHLERADKRSKYKISPTSNHGCEICLQTFRSINDLQLHLSDHAYRTKDQADTHKKSIQALLNLNYQMRTDKLRKRHLCAICKRVYLNRTDLRRHMNSIHAEGRPFQCQLCPKNYKQRSHLTRHEMTHCRG